MTSSRIVLIAWLCCFCLVSKLFWAAAANHPCTRAQAQKAEAEVDRLKTWHAIYLSFTRYANCDDGAIAEGYSESVAQLLANQWQDLEELEKLTSKNREFYDFVLGHIDESISADESRSIGQNARSHCPASGKMLCQSILRRVSKTR